jgi:ribosomal protein L7Ae-like RNA K-turn-binding protein
MQPSDEYSAERHISSGAVVAGKGAWARAPRPKVVARRPHASLSHTAGSSNTAAPSGTHLATSERPAAIVVPPSRPTYASLAAEMRHAPSAAGQDAGSSSIGGAKHVPRPNAVAFKIATGKKLRKEDLAGYTEKEIDAIRLHRSLQYRQTDGFKQKQQEAQDLQRETMLSRWSKGGDLAKPSRAVHMADHIAKLLPRLPPPERVVADTSSRARRSNNAIATKAEKLRTEDQPVAPPLREPEAVALEDGTRPVRLPGARVTAWGLPAPPTATSSEFRVAPAAAVTGLTSRPRVTVTVASGKTKKLAEAEASREAPQRDHPTPPPPERAPVAASDNVKIRRTGRGSAAAAALLAPSPAGPSNNGGANSRLRAGAVIMASDVLRQPPSSNTGASHLRARAAAAIGLSADRARPFKVREFRKLKKLSKVKWHVQMARRDAMREAAALVGRGGGLGTNAAAASDGGSVDAALRPDAAVFNNELYEDAMEDDSGTTPGTMESTPQPTSKRQLKRRENVRRRAIGVLKRHLKTVKAASDLQAQVKDAYERRDRDLLEQKKVEYRKAYGRVHRQSARRLRKYITLLNEAQTFEEASVRDCHHGNSNRREAAIGETVAREADADGNVAASQGSVSMPRPDRKNRGTLKQPSTVVNAKNTDGNRLAHIPQPARPAAAAKSKAKGKAADDGAEGSDGAGAGFGGEIEEDVEGDPETEVLLAPLTAGAATSSIASKDQGAVPAKKGGAHADDDTADLVVPAGMATYPSMHELSTRGFHRAPWLVDRRFAASSEFLQKHAAPHFSGRVPAWDEVLEATLSHDLAAPRPFWWPPQRVVRDYVTNLLSRPLDKAVEALVSKLCGLQAKLRKEQPLKYAKQMRYVLGMREAVRGLRARRVRLLIVAPDVEAIDVLDSAVAEAVQLSRANGIPHVFACGRASFGRAVRQYRNRVSLVAIYSAQGAYDELREVVRLTREAQSAYAALFCC